MASTVELTGGAFQDISGNPLAYGYLLFSLSQDGQVNSTTQIAAGKVIKFLLDANGDIQTSPPQYIWPNDVITPSGTFYYVSAYTAEGQLVWGPNAQQVLSSPSPYPVGNWVPGNTNVISGNVVTYDIGVFIPGLYLANQVVLYLPIERTVQFSPAFSPSRAACVTNPTAQVVFTINKNGTQIGTLTVNTDGSTAFSGSGTTFYAGDIISIVAPSSPDVTLANLGVLLSGVVL